MFALGGSQKQSPPPVLPDRELQPAAAASTARRDDDGSADATSTPLAAKRGADRDGERRSGSAVGRRRAEHGGGQRTAAPRREAGSRRGDGGRRLHAAEPHERRRRVLLPRRHDDPSAPRRPCPAAGERDRERPGVDRGGPRGALRASGGFSVGYRVSELQATRANGHVVVTGRISYEDGSPPPPVVLYTYRLVRHDHRRARAPVAGATVVTRTQDRNFWTFSQPSDASGHYVSFFTASDQAGEDPVPLTVQVASGASRTPRPRKERQLLASCTAPP